MDRLNAEWCASLDPSFAPLGARLELEHGFVVGYDQRGQSHREHADGSDLTVNLCLSTCAGAGRLIFPAEGPSGERWRFLIAHRAGTAIVHDGALVHGAEAHGEGPDSRDDGARGESARGESARGESARGESAREGTPRDAVGGGRGALERWNLILFCRCGHAFWGWGRLPRREQTIVLSFLSERDVDRVAAAGRAAAEVARSDEVWRPFFGRRFAPMASDRTAVSGKGATALGSSDAAALEAPWAALGLGSRGLRESAEARFPGRSR